MRRLGPRAGLSIQRCTVYVSALNTTLRAGNRVLLAEIVPDTACLDSVCSLQPVCAVPIYLPCVRGSLYAAAENTETVF